MTNKLTVNEMIYKTLTTKITKEPKYRNELEALGYELVSDHNWSTYDYWGIRTLENNSVLLISKSYGGKKMLYRTTHHIQTKDIQKVDFENLIKTDRSATRRWMLVEPVNKCAQYKLAVEYYKLHVKCYEDGLKEIAELEKELARVRDRAKYWESMVQKAKNKVNDIVAEIKK